MLISMCSFATLCYAWDHDYAYSEVFNVTLYYDQSITYSGAKKYTYVDYEGKNCSEKHRCWFYGQYDADNEQRNFKDDSVKVIVDPLSYCKHTQTNTQSSAVWWRLCLNPKGVGNGVYAYGWMW